MANDIREFEGLEKIRTGIKYSIMDQRNDKFGLALRSEVLTPTGKAKISIPKMNKPLTLENLSWIPISRTVNGLLMPVIITESPYL